MLQKIRMKFASSQKRSSTHDPGSCLGYISIFLHLFSPQQSSGEKSNQEKLFQLQKNLNVCTNKNK